MNKKFKKFLRNLRNLKKIVLFLEKYILIVNFSIKMQFLSYLEEKTTNFFTVEPSFFVLQIKYSKTLPLQWKVPSCASKIKIIGCVSSS